jgi:hypothetical protein
LMMASRNEHHSPLVFCSSAAVLTVKVAARAGTAITTAISTHAAKAANISNISDLNE